MAPLHPCSATLEREVERDSAPPPGPGLEQELGLALRERGLALQELGLGSDLGDPRPRLEQVPDSEHQPTRYLAPADGEVRCQQGSTNETFADFVLRRFHLLDALGFGAPATQPFGAATAPGRYCLNRRYFHLQLAVYFYHNICRAIDLALVFFFVCCLFRDVVCFCVLCSLMPAGTALLSSSPVTTRPKGQSNISGLSSPVRTVQISSREVCGGVDPCLTLCCLPISLSSTTKCPPTQWQATKSPPISIHNCGSKRFATIQTQRSTY